MECFRFTSAHSLSTYDTGNTMFQAEIHSSKYSTTVRVTRKNIINFHNMPEGFQILVACSVEINFEHGVEASASF